MKFDKSDIGSSDTPRKESTTPRRPNLTPSRGAILPSTSRPSSISTPSVLKRAQTLPETPPKRQATTSRTLLESIQRALTEPVITPTKSRVVIISSDEEDATDIEPSSQPKRSQSTDSLFSLAPVGSRIESSVSRSQIKVTASATSTAGSLRPEPSLSQNVLRFARSPFGTDLDVMIIAHSREAQKILDDNHIAWGVQYEIARGVCSGLWTWDGVTSRVSRLKGKNLEAAFRVEKTMKGREGAKPSDMHIWRQLDLEQLAILENAGRGLGLMGEFQGVRDWYGGKIQQIGRVVKVGSSYKIKMEKMESRRSHRFARYYGSRRFLHIRVSEELIRKEREEVKRFFRRKFVLCGRVFVAFHAKERNVYLLETDENYERSPQRWCGDHLRKSFNQFINWHNPLEVTKNTKQVITKYTARFALGLSNSKPGLEFKQKNILYIDDITAEGWTQDKKDKLMTDGCGFINHSALRSIIQTIGYDSIPAGIQGRIGGSKGFFILHPTDNSSEPKIWIRDSQHKIQNKSFDRAHRILDLLCASQPSPAGALTRQSIVNLFANGVNKELLVRLMEQGLEEEVAPLLQWDSPHAPLFLYDAVNKCGGVSGVRTQRIAYSLNRVLGFTGRDWHDDDGLTNGDGDEDEDEGEAYSGRNEYSGAPFSLHEVAIELLQSGFDPRENALLHEKIGYIINTIINTSVKKHRIPLPQSVMSYIVPDPLEILEEGEVFYRFSRPRKDPETDLLQYALEGQILVGRYPIRLPSDMQLVKAVYTRELDRWPDVLVVSIKGKRSIASLLADGGKLLTTPALFQGSIACQLEDMDGDEALIIYDQVVVGLFQNRSFTEPPPNFIEDNFKRDVESVERFCDRISGLSTRNAHEAFQDVLISNLSESIVGLYSMMHENACLQYGYDSERSIRLAYVFATLLDSSKNGCRLKDGLLQRDRRDFGSKPSASNNDILTILEAAGEKKGIELKRKYEHLGQIDNWVPSDEALRAPVENAYRTAQKYSARGFKDYKNELSKIEAHVAEAYQEWRTTTNAYHGKTASPCEPVKKSRKKTEDIMLPCARRFAEDIPGIELIQNVEEVKASCAYVHYPKMAFAVAFRRLCLIKAESKPGGLAPCVRIFDDAKKVSSSFLKALEWADEDHLEESTALE